MKELEKSLLASSQRWAYAGVGTYIGGNGNDFAAHHVMVALEHLAKSYLCHLSPALIASDEFETILHLAGLGEHANRPLGRIKTIGPDEACQRVKKILKGAFPYLPSELQFIIHIRNGVAHAGLTRDDADIRRGLTYAIRLMDALLLALGIERHDYWREYDKFTATMLNELATRDQLGFERKLAVAREQFRVRFGDLAPIVIREAWAVYAGSRFIDEDHAEEYECVVCQQNGWLDGLVFLERQVVESSSDAEETRTTKRFYPLKFDCGICGLRLNDRELKLAGLPDEIDLGMANEDDIFMFGDENGL